MKPVVIGIAIKRVGGKAKILTQKRIVEIRPGEDPPYDPLYDGTWEAMGETLKEGESVMDALVRGFAEECGHPDFAPLHIYGAEGETSWTTGKEDNILCCEPFCFVQQMGPPQPWLGPVFVVEVEANFEPDHSKSDGEAEEPRWWQPKELLTAIQSDPKQFMGLHMPALEKLCWAILTGTF